MILVTITCGGVPHHERRLDNGHHLVNRLGAETEIGTVMNMTLLMVQDACYADIVDLFCHLVIFCAPPAENAIGAGGLEADQTPISALHQMFQDFNTFRDKFQKW